MDALPPSTPPAISICAETSISQEIADSVLIKLKSSFPATRFVSAKPASVPGWIALTLENNQVAYTDKSGRYLFLGIAFDTLSGVALDGQLNGKQN